MRYRKANYYLALSFDRFSLIKIWLIILNYAVFIKFRDDEQSTSNISNNCKVEYFIKSLSSMVSLNS